MISLLLCLPLFSASSSPSVDERPNIVWISVEDMSPWLGCYGDETVPTPNVDRLAARGTRYTKAYANAPVCAPARATLITGCYATAIGAMHMRTGKPSSAALASNPGAYDGIPSYEATPPADVRCFPELLREAGYYCTNASKRDYQFKEPVTVWDASGGKAHWKNRPDKEQPFFAVFNLTMTHESGAFKKNKRRPRVADPAKVSVPPYYPDTPIVREDIARTYDNIAAMDARVGKILGELEAAGHLEDTIIVFFSDHGVGLPRGKRYVYASGTHVPLIVCHPGAKASVTEQLVSFVDFAPTTLSLAGIEPPAWMMGHAFDG
ncbi:MAG: sulfatase, partial [Planctomycetota bacterium]|nr:sulfatase [Planctomycetota bacterium]